MYLRSNVHFYHILFQDRLTFQENVWNFICSFSKEYNFTKPEKCFHSHLLSQCCSQICHEQNKSSNLPQSAIQLWPNLTKLLWSPRGSSIRTLDTSIINAWGLYKLTVEYLDESFVCLCVLAICFSCGRITLQ